MSVSTESEWVFAMCENCGDEWETTELRAPELPRCPCGERANVLAVSPPCANPNCWADNGQVKYHGDFCDRCRPAGGKYEARYWNKDAPDDVANFSAPEGADKDEIWAIGMKAMLFAHGHEDITCWSRV